MRLPARIDLRGAASRCWSVTATSSSRTRSIGFRRPQSVRGRCMRRRGWAAACQRLVSRGGYRSRELHTDPGAIFVLQTAGSKHWRVWAPPPATARIRPSVARGIGVLDAAELAAPLLEVTLEPGSLLFVGAASPTPPPPRRRSRHGRHGQAVVQRVGA